MKSLSPLTTIWLPLRRTSQTIWQMLRLSVMGINCANPQSQIRRINPQKKKLISSLPI